MSPAQLAGPVRPVEGTTVRRLGDGGVLVNLRNNEIYEFNSTGIAIWELLCAGLSQPEMITALVAEFDVSSELAREAIVEHLGALRTHGLLESHAAK